MCVSTLGQVVAVDAAGAVVDAGGVARRAATRLYPDVRAGEWVLVGAGAIVQRLTPEEARLMADLTGAAVSMGGTTDERRGVSDADR